ncbi:hypothetical protein [Phyllobacterium sp. SB3]|uniref:hypothetical protein n=1 Tax=Phyllobacterium sp. SB3 TaxID=3156073 RepID=UPI0032AF3A27
MSLFDFLFTKDEETLPVKKTKNKPRSSVGGAKSSNPATKIIDPDILVQEQVEKGRPIVEGSKGPFMADQSLLNDYRQAEARASRDSGFARGNNPKAKEAQRLLEEQALSEQMEKEEELLSNQRRAEALGKIAGLDSMGQSSGGLGNPSGYSIGPDDAVPNEFANKVNEARGRKQDKISEAAKIIGQEAARNTPAVEPEEPSIWDRIFDRLKTGGEEAFRGAEKSAAEELSQAAGVPFNPGRGSSIGGPALTPDGSATQSGNRGIFRTREERKPFDTESTFGDDRPAAPVPESRYPSGPSLPVSPSGDNPSTGAVAGGNVPSQIGPVTSPQEEISRKERLAKLDTILGGMFAPEGTPQPENAKIGNGYFPDAPKVTGNESYAPVAQPGYLDNAPQFPDAPNASNPFQEEKKPFFDLSVIGAALGNLDPRFPTQGNDILQRVDARRKLQMGQKELLGQQRSTYDWLVSQGKSSAEAEAMARNPDILREFIQNEGRKAGKGSGGAAGGYFAGIEWVTDPETGEKKPYQRRKDTGQWEEVDVPGNVQTPEDQERLKRQGGAYGKEQGESLIGFDKVNSDTSAALGELNVLEQHPGLDGSTGLFQGMASMRDISLTPEGRDFLSRVDKVVNGSFLTAFNSLRGGGQITEAEGSKATGALQRLQDFRLSPSDWVQALNEYKTEIIRLHKIAARRATMSPEEARQDALKAAESGPEANSNSVAPGASASQGQSPARESSDPLGIR